jgi:hypothetical protein
VNVTVRCHCKPTRAVWQGGDIKTNFKFNLKLIE